MFSKQQKSIVIFLVILCFSLLIYVYFGIIRDKKDEASFTAVDVCKQKSEELQEVSVDVMISDPLIKESVRAWKELYFQQNNDIFNQKFLDTHLHVYKVEVEDVPLAANVDSEKYLSIQYAFTYDWAYMSANGGIAIQLKGQPQMSYDQLIANHSNNTVILPWVSNFHIPQDEKQSMRTMVQKIQDGYKLPSCEVVVNELNRSCVNMQKRGYRDVPAFLLSFGGTINQNENKCGIGSIDLFTNEVSCKERPCSVN